MMSIDVNILRRNIHRHPFNNVVYNNRAEDYYKGKVLCTGYLCVVETRNIIDKKPSFIIYNFLVSKLFGFM